MTLEVRDITRQAREVLERAKEEGHETLYDRYEAAQPQCRFGKLGVCCRVCNMGPCRISKKTPLGICGADAETIVSRNFARRIAAGAAAHSDHGRSVAELLIMTAKGEAQGYEIRDEIKLRAVAADLDVETEGRTKEEIAKEVGEICLRQFGQSEGDVVFVKRAPEPRQKLWNDLGLTPRAVDREVTELMHRTGMGSDQDYKHIMRQGSRTALADGWGGSMIATELQDILFGTPIPRRGNFDLGVIDEDNVNLVIHGHEPQLSEMIALASHDPEIVEAAKSVGAKGIGISGVCCTGNELLMRHGIPVAGNMKQQEVVLSTGAIEAIVVDIQCIMQGVCDFASRYHTKVITTSPKAQITGATHLEFHEENGLDAAKEIIKTAIDNFANRDGSKVFIPDGQSRGVVGFSHETILYMLGGSFRASYRPLNDNIINGRIRGVVGVVGCTNPKIEAGQVPYIDLVKKLISNDFLVVTTGCAAVECGKAGLLLPEMQEIAGPGLREVCEAVGIPPVLHAGACVDNSRILIACSEMVREGGLGEDASDLPVAGACFEWMHDKAVAIGQYFVASGVFTVFGIDSPVSGSPVFEKYLTQDIEEEVGGRWAFEPDVDNMAQMIMDHIEAKRDALGINVEAERKLYDMEDRRKLEV